MRNIVPILTILLFLSSCKGQKKEITYHPIVLKAKETSLYSDEVDWKKVNAEFEELTEGQKNTEDLKQGLQYLLNSLGDKHGQFRSAKDNSLIVSYNGKVEGTDNRDPKFISTVINDISAKFSYKLLSDRIGYLRIVGIGPGNIKEQSDFIRKGLIDLKSKGVEKWIVDLRFNGGGNMEPMISGLAPLIGEGFIAGSINKDNEIRGYTIENGQFTNFGRLVCEMDSRWAGRNRGLVFLGNSTKHPIRRHRSYPFPMRHKALARPPEYPGPCSRRRHDRAVRLVQLPRECDEFHPWQVSKAE